MKLIFLLLFIITGCSTTRFYRAADVSHELKNNSQQLTYLTAKVENDFQDKEAFYQNYYKESSNKDNYILGDLAYRLNDLKLKRDSILSRSHTIKKINDSLLSKMERKKKIQEGDPIYQDIEAFAVITQRDAKKLYEDYAVYKKTSNEFAKFAMFTGNMFKKSTSVRQ